MENRAQIFKFSIKGIKGLSTGNIEPWETTEEVEVLAEEIHSRDFVTEFERKYEASGDIEVQEVYSADLDALLLAKPAYRVIIAGGRDFMDYELVREKANHYLQNKLQTHSVIIVSGHASGADTMGERYAQEKGLPCELHPADWKTHGKAAGPIRNAEMAAVADALIAFWDGQSRGTANMINLARQKGLTVAVVNYTDKNRNQ